MSIKPGTSVVRYYERMAQVVFLLVGAPRTIPELIHLLGMTTDRASAHTQMKRYLLALEEEGLVAQVGFRDSTGRGGRKSVIWAWVPRTGSATGG